MPATVLKSKQQIYHGLPLDANENQLTFNEAYEVANRYAEQNSIAFVHWRADLSLVIGRRHILNLPLWEQYQLFLKENGL